MVIIKNLFVWILCVGAAVLALIWQLFAAFANAKRFWKISFGFDQTLNASWGGSEDEMVSTRVYRKAREGKTWAIWAEKFLNWLDPNHTADSYENDFGEKLK